MEMLIRTPNKYFARYYDNIDLELLVSEEPDVYITVFRDKRSLEEFTKENGIEFEWLGL